ncbi:MAG: LPS assembly lipoprotein LptE [Chitinivibrionia bacterium]|nr:LPS assembly lipoprotein LptE [Chitinivibrionia bacterium]
MKFFLIAFAFCFASCIYTFSGSTLPSNIKTIEVPLFENMALVHGAAESITEVLAQKVVRERLTLVARNGDAIIKGVVVSYRNTASDYTGTRDNLTILSSSVEIVADIVFLDVKNGKEIYKGRVVSIGQYNFETESEADGRQRAVEDITEKILMNSIRSW